MLILEFLVKRIAQGLLIVFITSLIIFMYDIHLSLVALKLELKQVKPDLG